MTIAIACSSDYTDYIPEIDAPEIPIINVSFTEEEMLVLKQMRNPGNRICINEATEIALDALDFFGGEISTRSGQARTIAGVTALRSEPETRMTTRSIDGNDVEIQLPDTVAFVFNFADEAGFTIVAADTRITSPVFAFVEYGNLDLSQEIDHPGLAIFFAGLEEYIEWSIIEAEKRREALMDGILAKVKEAAKKNAADADDPTTRWWENQCRGLCWMNPDRCWCACAVAQCWCGGWCLQSPTLNVETVILPFGPWETFSRIGPLLLVEWHQDRPFNELVRFRNCSEGSSPAGCVAVATAQIMAFWEHPEYIGRYRMNWGLLNTFTTRSRIDQEGIPTPIWGEWPWWLSPNERLFIDYSSRLMERIGHYVGMTYSSTGSGAPTQNAINFLRNHNYLGGERSDYNLQAVLSSLRNERPVIIEGAAIRREIRNTFLGITISTTIVYDSAHAWNIDGYLRRSRPATLMNIWYFQFCWGRQEVATYFCTTLVASPTFLHNNWGWGGYFRRNDDSIGANGFFIAGAFDSNRNPVYNSSTRAGTPGNYQFRLRIFTNIRR